MLIQLVLGRAQGPVPLTIGSSVILMTAAVPYTVRSSREGLAMTFLGERLSLGPASLCLRSRNSIPHPKTKRTWESIVLVALKVWREVMCMN